MLEIGVTWSTSSALLADTPLYSELTISQIKITGDETVVLKNNTASNLLIGNYWLQYFNDFNLSASGVSNSSAQLPNVTLQPGQEILLASGTSANCGQIWVTKLPFSLKDAAGLLQVVSVNQTSGIIGYRPQDQVSWSSKAADPTDIKGVSSSSPTQNWYKNGTVWQSTATPVGCLAATTGGPSLNGPIILSQSTTSPPSIVMPAEEPAAQANLPTSDIGLIAPQISELLPNPAAPQTDAEDEFIELYNPNDASFDLSGLVLRAGTSTTHGYTFPDGSILQPREFKAFFALQTDLTLSNSEGRAQLLDLGDNVLAQTDIYSSAKDGYAWVFAEGLWQWTTQTTPNATNVISAPPPPKTTKSKKSSNANSTAVKSSKTSNSTVPNTTTGQAEPTKKLYGLHPAVLAMVGSLALIYACYEYRHDLANFYHRLNRNREARRTVGRLT
jgi:hypothetical protein